jgi:hypothetical protein
MDRTMDYCRRIAADCARRASETSDDDVRLFFTRMRDNWTAVANGLTAARPDAGQAPGLSETMSPPRDPWALVRRRLADKPLQKYHTDDR